tara:strand:- start:2699 stop:3085 length:387 start_codon:yes stop_codon:yes gene_type:complete
MSTLVHDHIGRIDETIELLESRGNALREIHDTISDLSVFTPEEQTAISTALEENDSRLAERQEARRSAMVTLETTIAQCERDLTDREGVLNELFNRERLLEYQDMMGFFREQHDVLKDTITRSIPTDE